MADAIDTFEEILSLRASGHVKRWHTIRTLTQQTVAEHSGQALTLLLMLHPNPSLDLIKATLWHDSAERVVGDVPAPALRANPTFKREYLRAEEMAVLDNHPSAMIRLTAEEDLWLKAVDRLEAFLHAHDEIKLGNTTVNDIFQRAYSYLVNNDPPAEVMSFVVWYMSEGKDRNFT